MDLQTIASEMKTAADGNPLTINRILEGLEKEVFPEILIRKENVEPYGQVHIQFSIDQLNSKIALFHLSFSKNDMQVPSDQMIADFQSAFFGEMINVLILPPVSNHDHIIQMIMKI